MAERFNVLYFISHDTGRFLGCYGRPIPFSPNLDAFAAQVVKFNRAYCSAPCCGPSRVCAMTGKYSHVTGTLGLANWGWPLPESEPTLVDYFNQAGYQTVHMGFCHERRYGEMRYQLDGVKGVDEWYWKCDSRLAVDNAIEYLKSRDRSQPFYLNLSTNETHAGHYGGDNVERHGGPVPEAECWLPPLTPDLPGVRWRYANWYASLHYLDGHFGRLLETIDKLGLAENTVVVYTTDHGAGVHRGKGHIYEPGMEIALLVRPPKGMRTGYSVEHLIPNIDFAPTWLEACGINIPAGLDGRSFWPMLAGQEYRPHERIFLERNFHGEYAGRGETQYIDKYDPVRSVRTADYQYIRNFWPHARKRLWYRHEITGFEKFPGREWGEVLPVEDQPRPEEELYDTRHDPWEQVNLIGRLDYEPVRQDLAAALDRWMKETDDPALQSAMPKPLEEVCVWPTKGQVLTATPERR